jgi:PAS domain S-box-containing protein
MKENRDNKSQELKNSRRQAEIRLRNEAGDGSGTNRDDLQKLIHELKVHQIELEMQNEELRRSQLELAESRDEYHALYDFAPVGYFTLNEKALIKQVNLMGADLLGVHRSKLIDTKFTGFISPDLQDDFYFHCNRIFETGTKQICDLKLLKQDGTFFYARLDSAAVKDKIKNSKQIRIALTDITKEKRASELVRDSEKKLRQMFSHMVSGSALTEVIFNKNGKPYDYRFLEVNPAFEYIIGKNRSQVVEKTLLDVFPETERYWLQSLEEVALTGNPIQIENYHRGLDKYFFVSGFRPQEGQLALTFIDITDRKNFEIDLQKSHDNLDNLVNERTAELTRSNVLLKKEIADRKQAEQALENERRRLFSVLNELPAFIYLQEPNHSIRFANRYFTDHFGSYAKKKCYEILKGKKEACEDCLTFRVFETDQPQEWESSGFRDGRLYQIYDYPFTDIDGSKLVLELGIDITGRKQAESEIRRLSSRLLNAQEAERRRIAFELHDDLGQDLLVLKLQMGSLKRKMHNNQFALREKCDHVLLELKKTIEKVRNISHALSPSILEDLGLSAALRWLVNNYTTHYNVEASTDIPDTINVFSQEQQIVIYRIFQEILTNIGKHSHATKVYVDSEKKDGTVFFRVADNGIGFDLEQIQARSVHERGLGLAAMDERLKMLGGQFEISSREGKGTQIAFEIPIHSTA